MKKMTVVLVALTAALLTVGFSCINDPFIVSVNLPISATFDVNHGNAGSNATYSDSKVVALKDEIDQSYLNKIKNVRSYDLRISTIGDFGGNVSGVVTINGTTILTFSGAWNDFHTSQSVLGSSLLVHPNQPGVLVLLGALNAFESNSEVTVTLGSTGTISTPFPAGLQMKVELLSQVDAEVSGS